MYIWSIVFSMQLPWKVEHKFCRWPDSGSLESEATALKNWATSTALARLLFVLWSWWSFEPKVKIKSVSCSLLFKEANYSFIHCSSFQDCEGRRTRIVSDALNELKASDRFDWLSPFLTMQLVSGQNSVYSNGLFFTGFVTSIDWPKLDPLSRIGMRQTKLFPILNFRAKKWSEKSRSETWYDKRQSHIQCDQIVRLFFNICQFAAMKISPIMSQICQSMLSILPNKK